MRSPPTPAVEWMPSDIVLYQNDGEGRVQCFPYEKIRDEAGIVVPPFEKGGLGGLFACFLTTRGSKAKPVLCEPGLPTRSNACGLACAESRSSAQFYRQNQSATTSPISMRPPCGWSWGGGWPTLRPPRKPNTTDAGLHIWSGRATSTALHRPAGVAGAGPVAEEIFRAVEDRNPP